MKKSAKVLKNCYSVKGQIVIKKTKAKWAIVVKRKEKQKRKVSYKKNWTKLNYVLDVLVVPKSNIINKIYVEW